MRETKFRGKRLDNGEWIYGDLVHHGDRIAIADRFVEPSSVGQYTGRKDKNGVEIYEGDVIKSTPPNVSFHGHPLVVRWEDWLLSFTFVDMTGKNEIGQTAVHTEFKYMEVIGNICENPGLLEKTA